MLALSGLKVLDVTQVMAGPFCSQLLGDLGAQVIKVEPPGSGDSTRLHMGTILPGGESSAFLAVNRNKRSISIDLKDAHGLEVFRRLVEDADVLVENLRPGVTRRLGIDYETLREVNPQLIYASISGFGQNGPYAQRSGYDLIAQAMSGVMSVTGEPGREPVKCGIPIADLSAGLFCAIGILSAHIARQRTGEGQHIDVSLFESALALSIWETAELWATGKTPGPVGSAHRMSAPYQKLRTADGHVVVGANNERLWKSLCAVIGRPELETDTRFVTNTERMRHLEELTAELESAMTQRGTEEWMERFLDVGLPAAPIHDYAQVCVDPHTIARNMVVTMEHPTEGNVHGLGIPIKMSGTPGQVRSPAPLLGAHTTEILKEAGYTEEQISTFQKTGAVR